MIYCEHCGSEITKPIPVEPLYDLELAAFLVPCKLSTFKWWLRTHAKDTPKLYRRARGFVKVRIVDANTIKRARAHFVLIKRREDRLTTVTDYGGRLREEQAAAAARGRANEHGPGS